MRNLTFLAYSACRYLVFGDLAARIQCSMSQPIHAFRSGPMVRNENRIGPDRSHHCRLHSHFAAARRHDYPVLILNIMRSGEPRVDLDARLRVLIHQGAYAARLRAG